MHCSHNAYTPDVPIKLPLSHSGVQFMKEMLPALYVSLNEFPWRTQQIGIKKMFCFQVNEEKVETPEVAATSEPASVPQVRTCTATDIMFSLSLFSVFIKTISCYYNVPIAVVCKIWNTADC